MSDHQDYNSANELWTYFQSVINWVNTTFPNYRKEMKGIDWGDLHRRFGNPDLNLDPKALDKEITRLMIDDDVTNKRGIYAYVLDKNERHLNIRAFSEAMKRAAYEKQGGLCKMCGKSFAIEEMEGDHITPWSQGGKTDKDNCQMLCKACNREKGGR